MSAMIAQDMAMIVTERKRADMNNLIREQQFARWLISKILALYITQDSFRDDVNSKVNDGYTFSINGEKLSDLEQAEWKLDIACENIAKQFTEYYFITNRLMYGDDCDGKDE